MHTCSPNSRQSKTDNSASIALDSGRRLDTAVCTVSDVRTAGVYAEHHMTIMHIIQGICMQAYCSGCVNQLIKQVIELTLNEALHSRRLRLLVCLSLHVGCQGWGWGGVPLGAPKCGGGRFWLSLLVLSRLCSICRLDTPCIVMLFGIANLAICFKPKALWPLPSVCYLKHLVLTNTCQLQAAYHAAKVQTHAADCDT